MEALRLAGFSVKAPRWEVALPDAAAETANLGRYVHISPFANDDYKELPADVLAQVVDGLREAQPDLALVISCAPTEREKRKLDVLLSQLDHKPDAVFPGNLDLVTFAGVLGRAALHMGADSGALHLAMLAGCPMVGWFRKYAAMEEWVPDFGHSRVLVGEATPGGVSGISASDVVSAAVQLLEQSR